MRQLLRYTIASQLLGTCAETFSLQFVFYKMNLSDTSRESSVKSARLDEEECFQQLQELLPKSWPSSFMREVSRKLPFSDQWASQKYSFGPKTIMCTNYLSQVYALDTIPVVSKCSMTVLQINPISDLYDIYDQVAEDWITHWLLSW